MIKWCKLCIGFQFYGDYDKNIAATNRKLENKSIKRFQHIFQNAILLKCKRSEKAMTWLTGWNYRKSHTVSGSTAGAQTNYQIKLILHYGTGTSSGENVYCENNCQNDFGDIRFTNYNGASLDFWIESQTSGDNAVIWVEVDSIAASPETTTIYMYYGKSGETTTSAGDATFMLFDDFTGDSINTDKWVATTAGSPTL